ncbi:LacI family DNA-binding transcriptional regulator [Microbacteriaceae bacterium VKM Ac-2855]|nr:LacI family DNA-binding transcriptional regulator [Microbacteriaceae bacterium VKM Ac-2855]
MRDVAAHVGVSRQLVSLVLRGAPGPSAGTRERVLASAAEIGYHANASARLLRQGRTQLLGVVFHLGSAFESAVAERLVARAAELGFGTVLGPITPDRPVAAVLADLIGQRVEGLAFFVPSEGIAPAQDAAGIVPVAVLGAAVDDDRFDNVHVDDRAGLGLAIDHLVAFGHRRIAYVHGGDNLPGRGRLAAYEAAMRSAGLGDEIDIVGDGFDEEHGASAARELLARTRLPTAIVCSGDQGAAGVLAVFARAGVRVPEDVSVIGFDDSAIAALSYHRLTSVRQDAAATAEEAIAALLGRLDSAETLPRTVRTPAQLVVRSSTGPARTD